MGKRAHGEGTITQRADGTWMAQISLGINDHGKRLRPTIYGRTKKEVREKLDALKQQRASGTLSLTKLTVRSYMEQWLVDKTRQLKSRSIFDYRYNCEKYIIPLVGHVKLAKLTPVIVQGMMGMIADEVSADRANKCRSTLHNAMNQAVKLQLISRNPVEAVGLLKYERKEIKLWTPEQAERFLDMAQSHRLYALFYTAMSAGLSACELIGLRWADVQPGVLTVRQTRVKVGTLLVIETPKAKKGYCMVAITPDVYIVLAENRQRQDLERERLGELWEDNDLVFASEVGTPQDQDNLRRVRYSLMAQAEVPRVKLHDLRHPHSFICVRHGMDAKVLADRLGHSRASFAMDVYTHLFDEQRERSAVSILDFLPKREAKPLN